MPEARMLDGESVHSTSGIALSDPSHGISAPVYRNEVSVLDLVNLMLRNRRLLVGLPAITSVLVVVGIILMPRTYTASASLLPQSTAASSSRISSLAAQFGLNVPGADPSQSPAFYASLLQSREVLEPVVQDRFRLVVRGDSISETLIDLLKARGRTAGARLESAVDKLEERLTVSVDRQTGLVEFNVRTQSPELSYQIVKRMLAQVTAFNIGRLQSQAAAERAFVEQQAERAQGQLRQAENELKDFLLHNRMYANDPQLAFEYDRLQRTVSMRQELFTSLTQSVDQARIDEMRDTPPMAVVESPRIPARPDSRGLVLGAMLGLLLGALVGIVLAVLRDFMRRSVNVVSASSREFAVLRSEALADFRNLLKIRRSREGPSDASL